MYCQLVCFILLYNYGLLNAVGDSFILNGSSIFCSLCEVFDLSEVLGNFALLWCGNYSQARANLCWALHRINIRAAKDKTEDVREVAVNTKYANYPLDRPLLTAARPLLLRTSWVPDYFPLVTKIYWYGAILDYSKAKTQITDRKSVV